MSTRAQRSKNHLSSPRKAPATPTPAPEASDVAMAFQRPPAASSGVFTMAHIDTTPGAAGAMAPPAGTTPSNHEYRDLIRERYRRDLAARQHMAIYALRLYARPHHQATHIVGPYASEARAILEAVNRRHSTS